VEQVADLLGLHVRTVRNYVRDGRLKAVRIGKQYRIAQADVDAFTGGTATTTVVVRHAEASSIVQLDDVDHDTMSRLSTLVMGAVGARGADDPLHVQTVYDPQRRTMKVIVVGGLASTATLLRIIDGFVGRA
jgi:excisionase family DNA binding protein